MTELGRSDSQEQCAKNIAEPRIVVFSHVDSSILIPLIESAVNIVGVVEFGTRADLSQNTFVRGARWVYLMLSGSGKSPSPADHSRSLGIPFIAVNSMQDSGLAGWLVDRGCDILVVYRVPILPAELYTLARHAINLHPSLLPKYRGGHPLLGAIWDGEDTTGCTVHLLADVVDTGAIVAQREFPIPSGICEQELERYVEVEVGVPLLCEAIVLLASGTAELIEQPWRSPTKYAKRRSRTEVYSSIPFSDWPVERVWQVLRFLSLTPFELATSRRQWPFARWKVGEIARTPGTGLPGSLQRDRRGYYVSHGQGRIRLIQTWAVKDLIKWIIGVPK